MMPAKGHAVLSASSADRWLHCPPSVRLCESIVDKGSEYAAEGTEAHALCEYKLRTALGEKAWDPTETFNYYSNEMNESAEGYVTYVLELLNTAKERCKDPVVLIEQHLDFSRFVIDGFGTGDCVIIADGTLYVIDFKYGRGVEVDAKNNPQLMCYALGALELGDGIYNIDTVSMTIYQPRRGNISTFTMAKDDLLEWAEKVLAPTAALAYGGEGEYSCGDWCRFCKAKATCRKRAEYNLALARYDFQEPATLKDEEVADILGKVDDLTAWAGDVREYALTAAMRGKSWQGYKLVEGRSNRRYADEEAVAAAVSAEGYDPYEKKLLGITAMTALLGNKQFEDILGNLTYKPQGKPILVPESDKRPALENDLKEEFKNA